LSVLNPGGCTLDILTTASMIAATRIVITVDTMIAHLAGALGRPTWLLLKAEPDWRWTPERTTSSWYPTMRFYVQPKAGDWQTVVAAVASDLAALSADAG
jgi:ADP-heptose:LPS heptosyltransferase